MLNKQEFANNLNLKCNKDQNSKALHNLKLTVLWHPKYCFKATMAYKEYQGKQQIRKTMTLQKNKKHPKQTLKRL